MNSRLVRVQPMNEVVLNVMTVRVADESIVEVFLQGLSLDGVHQSHETALDRERDSADVVQEGVDVVSGLLGVGLVDADQLVHLGVETGLAYGVPHVLLQGRQHLHLVGLLGQLLQCQVLVVLTLYVLGVQQELPQILLLLLVLDLVVDQQHHLVEPLPEQVDVTGLQPTHPLVDTVQKVDVLPDVDVRREE